jgi:3',5'-cyclic AMP phosphodiesterase CpdA
VPAPKTGSLLAISDLHVEMPENRELVDGLRPGSDGDWLIVVGDVGEVMADIEWGLATLAGRFGKVVWVPGNHELWTLPDDPAALRGDARYRHIVEFCRRHGVVTPEDPYAVWEGPGGPLAVAPLFTLYDYSYGRNIAPTKELSLARAHAAGVVCTDEMLLYPDPYPSREEWCRARVRLTEARLAKLTVPAVLASHFPLVPEVTNILFYPEFAQWCGTLLTADWHRRFRAAAVVYGHLHIPRVTHHDGVPFYEVSLGYPRERQRRARPLLGPRTIVAAGGD